MRTRSALVGRLDELELVQRLVGAGAATVLLLGDAGIGKSRLLEALSDGWHQDGLVVLAGDCLPFAHPLPLLPFTDVLRRLARVAGGAPLRDALRACSPYVTTELSRLLPSLAETGGHDPPGDRGSPGGSSAPAAEPVPPEWRRERLYAAFADLVDALDGVAPVVLAVEDVHWADSSTLDLLTYLRSRTRASLVLTCRADEPDLPEQVAPWLVRMRRGDLAEVRLRPLTRVETGEQIRAITGAGPAEPLVAEVHALSEGNPFFTEQLVAGVGGGGVLTTHVPSGLTAFLQARVSGLPPGPQTVLDALAVAARPLTEALLAAVTGLPDADVRDGLRLLRERHLLADPVTAEGAGLRHVLLGQAAQERLLPDEHRSVHARVAQALQGLGDDSLAAATAAHWQRAGRPEEALRATVAAAEYATRVCAYADAAREWGRAVELARELPEAATALGVDWLGLLVRTVDCLDAAGQGEEAGRLAERSLADRDRWPDSRGAAAALLARGAHLRAMHDVGSARPLLEEAVRLFALEPPSREEAEAHRLLAYLSMQEGRAAEGVERLRRARDVARAAGSRSTEARVIANLAYAHVTEGRSEQALLLLDAGRALVDELDEAGAGTGALEWIEGCACVASWHLGRMSDSHRAAMAGYRVAERHGRGKAFPASVLLCNAVKALLEQGQVEPAAQVVREHAPEAVSADRWPLHLAHAAVDLRQGRLDAACERLHEVAALEVHGDLANTRELVEQLVEVRLWRDEPAVALQEAEQMLAQLPGTDEAAHAGELLGLAGRAVADLGEAARARRDEVAQHAALQAGSRLEALVSSMAGAPFTARAHHPAAVRVDADRLQWQAELARSGGASDPALWERCAREWRRLGRPHRAAYAFWRAAEALLTRRTHTHEARTALRQAAALADGMEPLLQKVTGLARRARLELAPSTGAPTDEGPPGVPTLPPGLHTDPFGLSPRERQVLDLLAAGRTNAQIGAELFISPKTASVHVTNILRKLGVDNRTHAAATAERAGLLRGSGRPDAGRRPAG